MRQQIFLLLILFCGGTEGWAQTKAQSVKFEYDVAGNRVLRQIVVQIITDADSLFKESILFDHLPDDPIEGLKVYPNPAHEIVYIEFVDIPDTSVKYLMIDMYGHLLERGVIDNVLTPLNLSHYTSGIYFLLIKADAKNETFKIIRQ
ncbi:MAG: T9SS type A sorting domain-containing protein [Bacteroidales bacterium]|nr:T9SS type A sorting domain-containing protein [Acholeplasmataceae bacterium]MCK9449034.1 T9SS type A sorting domain-containing protein [Bacteroidales bacterium]